MSTTAYNVITQSDQSTVVGHYERPAELNDNTVAYQSEADLESDFLTQLVRQGYEQVDITSEPQLLANLRLQLQRLNAVEFTDDEWQRFFKTHIALQGGNNMDSIAAKSYSLQRDYIKAFTFDNGHSQNIKLIDKKDIYANSLQVLHQYVPESKGRQNRYDVTILVNGLPMVHIELKRRGVNLREAFNQINRYWRETFSQGAALYEYVQLFVISNGTLTKYYSNTTRRNHVDEQNRKGNKKTVKTSNTFKFTSYWADAENKMITDLRDFTATFFSRHTLLNVLTRFCVFTEQNMLMAMRPYQIAATERLLRQVEIAHNANLMGKRDGGGYIWHTTGSGKTLTSFKAAQLATALPYVQKVIFVVDRKDLDYQTIREYDRFQKGAANGNTSTRELEKQLSDAKSRILVTTIQKLNSFVRRVQKHEVYGQEVVMIFDECHRSQFGAMHSAITKRFKKYYIFGFTGTPIFTQNRTQAQGMERTTEDVFGRRLHTYTIVDAIRDQNVLPFRIAYVSTIKAKAEIEDAKVWGIEREKALMDPRRISNVTSYILQNFNRQTKRDQSYAFTQLQNIAEVVAARPGQQVVEEHRATKLNGFNSIMAVQTIDMAKLYYAEFKKQMAELPPNKQLRVATIFTYAANEDLDDDWGDGEGTEGLDQSSRDFLDAAIKDYNETFHTNYGTDSESFGNYYKDISQRMKNRELDLLIVVNMFLTGFDATTLNTLWVDKNLRWHGLVQSFSRTNRILNAVKVMGNIVCFRNLQHSADQAFSLFGDNEAHGVSIIRPFDDYFNGYTDESGKWHDGYSQLIDLLVKTYHPEETPTGKKEQRHFVELMGKVLRMYNLLNSFEEFDQQKIITPYDLNNYLSIYNEIHEQWKERQEHDQEAINDDLEFEMELVRQVEVDIDYILELVALYNKQHKKDQELYKKIDRAITASPDLRDKRELIMQFIATLTPDSCVHEDWLAYANEQKKLEFETIISEERLRPKEARDFITQAFERGFVAEVGPELNSILPPRNIYMPNSGAEEMLRHVLTRLKRFFTKYFDIATADFSQ